MMMVGRDAVADGACIDLGATDSARRSARLSAPTSYVACKIVDQKIGLENSRKASLRPALRFAKGRE